MNVMYAVSAAKVSLPLMNTQCSKVAVLTMDSLACTVTQTTTYINEK